MSEIKHSGPRKLTDSENKLGSTLRAQLYFTPDEPVSVVIIGTKQLENDDLLEIVTSSLIDESFVRSVGGAMISAIVSPPDIRSKLAGIASNDGISAIELNEPLPPITIGKSYFR